MKYVDLVIDNKANATDMLYTYGCEDEAIVVGQKVYVYFGKSKDPRDAYVFDVCDEPAREFKNLKFVEAIDEEICLSEEMIETAKWMKDRYLCKYIDAVKLFTPAGEPAKVGARAGALEAAKEEEQNIETLTDEQMRALSTITKSIEARDKKRFLLWGVTGSGKTEVYMQVIQKTIETGRGAIMLVPEISLTKQIIARFAGRFGKERLAVLHSALSPGQRYDQWQKIRNGEVDIVIGARSAIFAPMQNIGLIIMDEEHEATYKSDMSPKYDTSEVAIKRGVLSGATFVLGSATPSVATYYRSQNGIYKLLTLNERYNKVALPKVEVVDMREEFRMGNKSSFSVKLQEAAKEELEEGRQVMLFLNRRGYTTYISCRECGHALKCPACGISLTYHKAEDRAICHYCGHSEQVPEACPECGSKMIAHFGAGTEKIQEEAEMIFPGYEVGRLDFDTAKGKGKIEKILDDFAAGKTHILTGTQLIAKGLDYPNVGLVGIISADVTLNIPDFRSPERTFQLLTQGAGRSGRGDREGRVIVQTYTPDNYAVTSAALQDYEGFFEREIEFRRLMEYPPFSDLIQVVFSSAEENYTGKTAQKWHEQLRRLLGADAKNVFTPQPMLSLTKREGYKKYILLKCPAGQRGRYMGAIKTLMDIHKQGKNKCSVTVDVNPYNLWRA